MSKLNLRHYKNVKERREALEKELGVDLKDIGSFSLDESVASGNNCENMIGATQVPLGIAGPLIIQNSEFIIQNCFVPLSTTEGALVASVNRGCKAISQSGGATVHVENAGVTRGPVFETTGLSQSFELKNWIGKHFNNLIHWSESTSNHLSLIRFESQVVGKYVFVRFFFDTTDAMGMNMVTVATEEIVRHIEEETGIRCISVAGNFDIDKKPAFLNTTGRGKRVWAEITVPESVLKDVLKTTASEIHKIWQAKVMIGSAVSGSLSFNAQYANIVAAFFLATGQDMAHVVEGSLGITTTEVISHNSENLYISVHLPAVMVGTVGGGTGLSTQKQALSIMGIIGGDNGKNALKLAEIIGGAVLAGELSLLASLAEGSLGKAHKHLARSKV